MDHSSYRMHLPPLRGMAHGPRIQLMARALRGRSWPHDLARTRGQACPCRHPHPFPCPYDCRQPFPVPCPRARSHAARLRHLRLHTAGCLTRRLLPRCLTRCEVMSFRWGQRHGCARSHDGRELRDPVRPLHYGAACGCRAALRTRSNRPTRKGLHRRTARTGLQTRTLRHPTPARKQTPLPLQRRLQMANQRNQSPHPAPHHPSASVAGPLTTPAQGSHAAHGHRCHHHWFRHFGCHLWNA